MKTIEDVAVEFEEIAERVTTTWIPHVPLEMTFRQRNWTDAALSPENLIWLANEIAARLREAYAENEDPATVDAEEFWISMARQAGEMDFSNFNSDPNAVARSTFQFLQYCNAFLPSKSANVDWEKVKSKGYIPRELSRKIDSIEKRIADLNPRAETLQKKIHDIESAHEAAEQLPTDMEELRRSKKTIDGLLANAQRAAAKIDNQAIETTKSSSRAKHLRNEIDEQLKQSNWLVEKCEENYRITTSAGLAGAFESRSTSLNNTGWVWVAILAVALVCAVGIGYFRIDAYENLLKSEAATSVILLNLLVTMLGVGGPIWLAWLATKNIGQSFKLAEDYAFKASISKAYEGYRKEAVSLDPEFAKQLFGSALTRLDEAPSRFIASVDHNSPMAEMLDNQTIKEFVAAFPEVQEKIVRFIVDQKNVAATTLGAAAATTVQKLSSGQDVKDNDKPEEEK